MHGVFVSVYFPYTTAYRFHLYFHGVGILLNKWRVHRDEVDVLLFFYSTRISVNNVYAVFLHVLATGFPVYVKNIS